MGAQCSTCISIVTENFPSIHIGYPATVFAVHGYAELSTFSRVVKTYTTYTKVDHGFLFEKNINKNEYKKYDNNHK
jgi:hypothetical protein